MCVLIFSTAFVWNIYRAEKNTVRLLSQIYKDVHVKYL